MAYNLFESLEARVKRLFVSEDREIEITREQEIAGFTREYYPDAPAGGTGMTARDTREVVPGLSWKRGLHGGRSPMMP